MENRAGRYRYLSHAISYCTKFEK